MPHLVEDITKYRKIRKNSSGGIPPPRTTVGMWLCLRVRGLKGCWISLVTLNLIIIFCPQTNIQAYSRTEWRTLCRYSTQTNFKWILCTYQVYFFFSFFCRCFVFTSKNLHRQTLWAKRIRFVWLTFKHPMFPANQLQVIVEFSL